MRLFTDSVKLLTDPDPVIFKALREARSFTGINILIISILSVLGGIGVLAPLGRQALIYILTWGVVIKLLFVLLFIIIISSVYNFSAGLLGYSGNPGRLFVLLQYSFAPFMLFAPFALVFRAFAGDAAVLLSIIVLAIQAAQSYYIRYRILGYVYGLTAKDSIIVFLMPYVIILGILMISAGIIGTSIISSVL